MIYVINLSHHHFIFSASCFTCALIFFRTPAAPLVPSAALMNDQRFANHEEFEATQNAIASWLETWQQNVAILQDQLFVDVCWCFSFTMLTAFWKGRFTRSQLGKVNVHSDLNKVIDSWLLYMACLVEDQRDTSCWPESDLMPQQDGIEFFSSFDVFTLELLLSIVRKNSYKTNQDILTQGTCAEALHVIYAGQVDVIIDGSVISRLGSQSILGERSICSLGEKIKPCAATIRPVTSVVITYSWPRTSLLELFIKDDRIYETVLRFIKNAVGWVMVRVDFCIFLFIPSFSSRNIWWSKRNNYAMPTLRRHLKTCKDSRLKDRKHLNFGFWNGFWLEFLIKHSGKVHEEIRCLDRPPG